MGRHSKWNESYIGKKYGYLTVLKFSHVDKNRSVRVICKCICGKIIKPRFICLRGSRQQKSCGCKSLLIHGYSKTKLYKCYIDMIERCNNPNHRAYKDYGGRGITVCNEWHIFLTFRFQMRKKYFITKNKYKEEKISIERINNNKGYYYENCTFIPFKFQQKNRRNVYPVKAINRKTGEEVYGKNKAELAKKLNVCKATICRNVSGQFRSKKWIIRPLLKNPQ